MRKAAVLVFFLAVCAVSASATAAAPGRFLSGVSGVALVCFAATTLALLAGLALLETGLVRAKNAANAVLKGLVGFCVVAVAFWLVGRHFLFGQSLGGVIGLPDFLSGADQDAGSVLPSFIALFLAALAAAVVSGAAAERMRFGAYLFLCAAVAALVFPVAGHWLWGGGWLADLGFIDFGASATLHASAGSVALVCAALLGPRAGKFVGIDGRIAAKAYPGHNLPLAGAGLFLAWLGWYGLALGFSFLGGVSDLLVPLLNLTLAGAAGTLGALAVSWVWFKKPDASMTMNGALAGLVAVSAGCLYFSGDAALVVGLLGGVIAALSVEFLERTLRVDDPVGAVSVHLANGVFGSLALGVWGRGDAKGLLAGGGPRLLEIQALGCAAIVLWSLAAGAAAFFLAKLFFGARAEEKAELVGLDLAEHKTEAYSGFQIFSNL